MTRSDVASGLLTATATAKSLLSKHLRPLPPSFKPRRPSATSRVTSSGHAATLSSALHLPTRLRALGRPNCSLFDTAVSGLGVRPRHQSASLRVLGEPATRLKNPIRSSHAHDHMLIHKIASSTHTQPTTRSVSSLAPTARRRTLSAPRHPYAPLPRFLTSFSFLARRKIFLLSPPSVPTGPRSVHTFRANWRVHFAQLSIAVGRAHPPTPPYPLCAAPSRRGGHVPRVHSSMRARAFMDQALQMRV